MKPPKIKVVIPFYNCEKWIARAIMSVNAQTYQNFEAIVINDASTDKSRDILNSLQLEKNYRFKVIHNEENRKALANIVTGFETLKAKEDPESILMVIDGDDFLFSEFVFEMIAGCYQNNPNLLLTYGNHVHHPTGGISNCEPIPKEVSDNNKFRDYRFVTSHLRTFKSKLWYEIKDKDLRNENNEYYSVGWDVAFMMPMLEMARDRTFFIPNILYCYNRFNPMSDDKIRQKDQAAVEERVRKLPRYKKFEE